MDKKKIIKIVLIGLLDAAIVVAIFYAANKIGFYSKRFIDKKKQAPEQLPSANTGAAASSQPATVQPASQASAGTAQTVTGNINTNSTISTK